MDHSTRIKFCGMTNLADALLAVQLGVDAIGFIFYPKSSRAVTMEKAKIIMDALPPFVCSAGVFVNEKPEKIEQILQYTSLDLLQFHGDETAKECERYQKPYIKAIQMATGVNLEQIAATHQQARGFLLDTFQTDGYGGSGKCFSWAQVPRDFKRPLILAGGLNPDNVAEAILACHPYAVDVVSGIESAPGIKSFAKMERFVEEVRKSSS